MGAAAGVGSILKTGLRSSEDFREGSKPSVRAQAELSRKMIAGEVISRR
jgi:hypothetical protein